MAFEQKDVYSPVQIGEEENSMTYDIHSFLSFFLFLILSDIWKAAQVSAWQVLQAAAPVTMAPF